MAQLLLGLGYEKQYLKWRETSTLFDNRVEEERESEKNWRPSKDLET